MATIQHPSTTGSEDVERRIADLRRRHVVESADDEVLTTKLRRRGHDVHTARTAGDISSDLQEFLARRIAQPFAITGLRRLPGGASKEQFSFTLEWVRDGETRTDPMVLRMNPPASVVETHRVREFQLLQAFDGRVPVPHAYWATQDREELGEPAMVCGFARGVAAPTKGERKASGLGTAYGPDVRPRLAEQFVAHLATIHTLDPAAVCLDAFEVPAVGTTESVERRLAFWDRTWEQDAFEPHPTVMLAREWLWANRPVTDHVSIVHGDYRNGNFLFDEDTGEMTAILDWELGHLGDRHFDLAYVLLENWGNQDDDGRFLHCGLLERDEFIAEYERLSGLSVDPERLRYYTVLNAYWLLTACFATGVRIAEDRMTHLDVMMNFMSGLGASLVPGVNRLIEGA
ncbi:MAG: phosphotransferase family protein [Solirubrobacteraceae bacterium]